jgi:hypothetical protein
LFLASLPGAPPTAAQLTALLDEMRHQELAVRLNAFRNLPHIAQAMGVNKTRKELIPYVTGAFVTRPSALPALPLAPRLYARSAIAVLSLTLFFACARRVCVRVWFRLPQNSFKIAMTTTKCCCWWRKLWV